MRSAELRERFLSFFERACAHVRRPSDSLVPGGDPTVLFTSAGMNQFKDYFLGRRADLTRAVSCQKCLRTGDLDRVGRTPSHHSFFEMLGNFSFGDYFKYDAIRWAWEFLTGTREYQGAASAHRALCLSLPAQRLWVSVYEQDDEAAKLWRQLGVPQERIRRFGASENFWPADAPTKGPSGPCGPCSEIYYHPQGRVDPDGSVEVWNLVFTQYDRQPDGTLQELPRRCIDTGMGLERLARVVQEKPTDYETDLFEPILEAIQALPRTTTRGSAAAERRARHAVADHVRAAVFLVAEGVLPSNESRGYVLRMLIRRAHRLGRTVCGIAATEGFLHSLVESVERAMAGPPYQQFLSERRDAVQAAIAKEEAQFTETLQSGTARLEEVIRHLGSARTISGDEAFKLYDTYGFPYELTADIAEERGLSVDRSGFEAAMQAQQHRSRAASQFQGDIFAGSALRVRERLPELAPAEAQFVGYEALQADARIRGLWDGQRWVDEAREGQTVGIVLDRSPFYGESGGQVGDTGRIEGPRGAAEVSQTLWMDDVLVHQATVAQGAVRVQDPVRASVDGERRLKIARAHTGTHLLHWALRKLLGPAASQAGSLVDAERVRFDVAAPRAVDEPLQEQLEGLVGGAAARADAVRTEQMELEAARRRGALAMFGEKYGRTVRVVCIGDYSMELCGGTHLAHTGLLGAFAIVAESSIAAGTRRLEALVGEAAADYQRRQRRVVREAARRLGRGAEELVPALEELLERLKQQERERKDLHAQLARVEARRLAAEGTRIAGVQFVSATIRHADREALAVLADAVRESMQQAAPAEGIVVLASADGQTTSFVLAATAGVAKRLHAGQLMKEIAAAAGGSGGGRPEFAQAGGKDPARIPEALRRAEELVRQALER
jgi:alanyl-tRNA synthetase